MLQTKFYHHALISTVFLLIVLTFRGDTLKFRFNPGLIERYYQSQDITHEVSNRIFLSDGDIYLATGYIYARGGDPSQNNFEHPPVVKYLFGFATLILGNPLIIQIIFGFILPQLVYLLGTRISGNSLIGLLGAILIIIDPLFIDTLNQPLLDMGQTVFMLGYFYLIFYDNKNWVGQGILLALFAGCKFWITPGFFIVLITLYKYYRHEINKEYIYHLAFSLVIYTLFYSQSYIHEGLKFNLVWHMLKTLKYRLVHNTATYFGASVLLFTSGYWKSWWDSYGFVRGSTWSLLWPLSLGFSINNVLVSLKKIRIDTLFLTEIIPISYLLFLGVQAPFPRYFLVILPFVYLSLSNLIVNRFIKNF